MGPDGMKIHERAFPRAGLIGNPSDGYFGKTISFTFENFCAEVVLEEAEQLEIIPNARDQFTYSGISQLAADVGCFGYYGGIRLLKASIKRFYDYCKKHDVDLRSDNFTIRYQSNIPHHVGLAGSSAIITACFRGLMSFYNVSIDKPELAELILSVERDELGIPAGLQDRVAQVYQGLVYMDFNRERMESKGYGVYEELDPDNLPELYIAYLVEFSEGSEVFHSNLRKRFQNHDQRVLEAVATWADLTDQARTLLLKGKGDAVSPLLDANFDKRLEIYPIQQSNIRMIEAARSVGASAKFTGSGGAIVGAYKGDEMFDALRAVMKPMNVEVVRPVITGQTRK